MTTKTPPDESNTTTTSQVDTGAAIVKVCLVRVLAIGGARPATVMLEREPVAIGREGHVVGPLALNDTEISRNHAAVQPEGDAWFLVDQGSRNGTFVNGARVEKAALTDGTVIRIGRTLMLFLEAQLRAGETFDPISPRLVGQSVAMLRLHSEIALVAPHTVPVLILGETGAGKELVAEEVHRLSGRKGAFVPLNCSAIAPNLAESELFGHTSGAFTGASRASEGLFVAAEGGTLFLDEIGEMPIDIQPKLLRALQKGEIRSVGAAQTRTVDVRVVAATNVDLAGAVAKESFRGDLLARLSGWTVRVPPLRDRRDDILPLATTFLNRRNAPPLSVDAAEALLIFGWPFNVRELEQVMNAAAVRASGSSSETVRCDHLPPEIILPLGTRATPVVTQATSGEAPLQMLIARDGMPSKEELIQALVRLDGNVARVAEFFGKERQQVYRWAKRYNMDLTAYRKE
jgi:transcriptional regulator with GAF, ATPase, and Fis domain